MSPGEMINFIFYRFFPAIMFSLAVTLQPAFAHPPQEISGEYRQDDKMLAVEFKHLSRDHNRHYLRKIVVTPEGEAAIIVRNHQQVSPTGFTIQVPLDLAEGKKVEIAAYCSKGGVKTVEYEVPEGDVLQDEDQTREGLDILDKKKSAIKSPSKY